MKNNLKKLKAKVSTKYVLWIGVVLIALVVILSGIRARALAQTKTPSNNPLLAQTEVAKEFTFEALLPNKKLSKVNLRLTSAEKRTEILVQGKPAQTKNDKIFLVLNLEIDNSDSLPKYMSPVDVFRLVSADGKLFAADVHSGMLEIQPLSTKLNKIAFVINKDDKQFNLKVGELEGDKEDIQINFN